MGMCPTFKWNTSFKGCRTRRDDGSVEAAGKDNVRKLKDPYDFSWGCRVALNTWRRPQTKQYLICRKGIPNQTIPIQV
jgi:hypothetical protein